MRKLRDPREEKIWKLLSEAKYYEGSSALLRKRLREAQSALEVLEGGEQHQKEREAYLRRRYPDFAAQELGSLAGQIRKRRDALTEKLRELRRNRELLEDLMSGLNSAELIVITERYIEGKSWTRVCLGAGFVARTGQRLQKSAVSRMARELREDQDLLAATDSSASAGACGYSR